MKKIDRIMILLIGITLATLLRGYAFYCKMEVNQTRWILGALILMMPETYLNIFQEENPKETVRKFNLFLEGLGKTIVLIIVVETDWEILCLILMVLLLMSFLMHYLKDKMQANQEKKNRKAEKQDTNK